MEPIATVTGLVQGYGRQPVISGLSLHIRPGVLGLLGPNGAGKTTLLRTLATVAPPQRGTISICGVPLRTQAQIRGARREIGYLPQSFGFFPAFSVYEFVRYCAWLRGVPDAQAHQATITSLEAVGLVDRRDNKLRSLSGGMLRRCGIAQAVVGQPKLLLLDEPTVGLDPQQRLEFRELIRSLTGVAVVISTHLVEDIVALCGEVRVMDGGRFVFKGSAKALAAQAAPDALGDTEPERGYMTVLGRDKVSA